MQLDASHQLHVVRHHVPVHLLTGDSDLGPEETARGFANGGKGFGQQLVEDVGDRGTKLRFDSAAPIDPAQLVVQLLALGGIGGDALPVSEISDARFDVGRDLADARAELLGLTAKLLLGDGLEAGILLVDLVDDRLNALALTIVASSEHSAQQPCQHFPVFLGRITSVSTIEPASVDEPLDTFGHESLDRFSRAQPVPDLRR